MNFEVSSYDRDRWNSTLKIMEDITKSSTTVPVVSIKADEEMQELELFVTNGAMSNPVEFVSVFDALIHEGGECMMSAVHFSKLSTMSKDEDLDFRVSPASCFIKGKDRYVEIPKIHFTPMERAKIPTLIEINKEDFKSAVKTVGSNLRRGGDQFETTLKIGSGEGGTVLKFFSADHHRMTMFTLILVHHLTKEIAIHQNSLKAIILFLGLEGATSWGFDEKNMYLKTGHMLLVVPLIEAYRADVGQLFEQQDTTNIQLTVDVKDAVEASRKCRAIYGVKKFSAPFVLGELSSGKLIFKSSANDLTAMTALECKVLKGQSGSFKLNPSYLENSLKNIEDVTALICFNDIKTLNPQTQLSGVVITGNLNDTTKHLVMQMRVENE